MSNKTENAMTNGKYDLLARTLKFAERVIEFAGLLPENSVIYPLKSQFIRSGTSIGANYSEADSAESRKDFFHKIGICRKEAKETTYWLQLIVKALPWTRKKGIKLIQESRELTLIFSAIFKRKSKT